ncbi:MAG TPA: enoyl-CoA hydratase-related protein [Candidatus Eisenbacteria bacterium]|jgi:cyclohexa-1,5-dienecarbonyl-CoA hydratase|nr:enoyl-CoA hydratase-related protein [Candidatus Eisenbacteria bacterium]
MAGNPTGTSAPPGGLTLRLALDGRIARITLDRPPLHVIDFATMDALEAAIADVSREPSIAAMVLTSSGDKAFSAGVDIKIHTPEKAAPMLERFHEVIRALGDLPCATIAGVRGVALGGGFELALACDMIVAEEGSSFGLPEIWLGCLPPVAAAMLPHIVTPQKAYEMVLTGEPITALEAKQLGLVNILTPRGTLDAALASFVSLFSEKSASSLRLAKRALRLGEEKRTGEALKEIERLYGEELMKTEDAREGIRAYLEKREAKWKDR